MKLFISRDAYDEVPSSKAKLGIFAFAEVLAPEDQKPWVVEGEKILLFDTEWLFVLDGPACENTYEAIKGAFHKVLGHGVHMVLEKDEDKNDVITKVSYL